MSFKALLTHVVDDSGCLSRLRMVTSVAKVLGAELIGVGAQAPWPYTTSTGSSAGFAAIIDAAERRIAAAEEIFHSGITDPAAPVSWRSELGYPDNVLARHARCADLVVAYPTMGEVDASLYARADTLVMECGLPLLLMPLVEKPFVAEHLLIAWKNTREARRAITASLPLLKQAGRVMVAAVCREQEVAEVEAQLSDVAQRLARHGVMAATLAEVEGPGAAARKLLRIAETDGSDVIIAGAYGHSRLREWVLGGVTRDLIGDGGRYVLLSH